jgi:hypothetical protein
MSLIMSYNISIKLGNSKNITRITSKLINLLLSPCDLSDVCLIYNVLQYTDAVCKQNTFLTPFQRGYLPFLLTRFKEDYDLNIHCNNNYAYLDQMGSET